MIRRLLCWLGGHDVIEVDRLVDAVNMYWMFIAPEDYKPEWEYKI